MNNETVMRFSYFPHIEDSVIMTLFNRAENSKASMCKFLIEKIPSRSCWVGCYFERSKIAKLCNLSSPHQLDL